MVDCNHYKDQIKQTEYWYALNSVCNTLTAYVQKLSFKSLVLSMKNDLIGLESL